MQEIIRVGDFYDDWRLHFDSLESIPQRPDIDVLAVGSNQGRERFPAQVLGRLPQLSGLYLRNFNIDFSAFGGHLPERLETINIEDASVLGPWFPHLGNLSSLKVLILQDASIETCVAAIPDAKLRALSGLWSLQANNATLPDFFFQALAKYATSIEQFAIVSTAGLTLELLDMIAGRKRLKNILLSNVGVTKDWIKSIRECDSLDIVNLYGNPDISSDNLVELAHLPNLTLRWLGFDHEKEPAEKLREFKLNWNVIKHSKFGTVNNTDRY